MLMYPGKIYIATRPSTNGILICIGKRQTNYRLFLQKAVYYFSYYRRSWIPCSWFCRTYSDWVQKFVRWLYWTCRPRIDSLKDANGFFFLPEITPSLRDLNIELISPFLVQYWSLSHAKLVNLTSPKFNMRNIYISIYLFWYLLFWDFDGSCIHIAWIWILQKDAKNNRYSNSDSAKR